MKKPLFIVSVFLVLSLMFAASALAGSTLQGILKKGEVTVGTSGTQPPMTATSKKGELMGMDIDISRAAAEAMGVKLRFVTMPFSELLPALEAGKIDLLRACDKITSQLRAHVRSC